MEDREVAYQIINKNFSPFLSGWKYRDELGRKQNDEPVAAMIAVDDESSKGKSEDEDMEDAEAPQLRKKASVSKKSNAQEEEEPRRR